jgi:proline iminopeptidase
MAREGLIAVKNAQLHSRDVGEGQPIVVVHGGPDFDHTYLLPELDRLADGYRLVYYDQRGRGRSAERVVPKGVTLESELADIDAVRQHFGFESMALLGHSFGTILALEYAIRHPARVSHLILMDPAPMSYADAARFHDERAERYPDDMAELERLGESAAYAEGDPETVTAYYAVHFRRAVTRAEDRARIVARLSASFTREGIFLARAIEDRLMDETLSLESYDLLARVGALRVPALIVHGDRDLFPPECAEHIASAMPNARRVTLKDSGHFSYLESPDATRKAMDDFFGSTH